MPLMPGKSKKAFSKNVETEMKAGKPQKQSLAIAFSVQRKNKKKNMAEGGPVDPDSKMGKFFESSRKAFNKGQDPTPNPSPVPKSYAKGGEVSASTEKRPATGDTHDDAGSVARNSGKKQPRKPKMTDDTYTEQSANHPGAPRNEIDADFDSDEMANIDRARSQANMNMHKESSTDPMSINPHHAEDIADAKFAQGGYVSTEEMEMEHAREMDMLQRRHERERLAHGGPVSETPEHDDMASAIMHRRKMAEGGQVDLSRNADEDPNMEDQQSFEALKKENYSESDGLMDLDQPEDSNLHGDDIDSDDHDMVGKIRSRMKTRRGF